MSSLNRSIWTAAAILSAVLLASCQSEKRLANCPSAAVLAPASTLTAFPEGAPKDPTAALYTVGLVDVKTDCELNAEEGTTESSLELTFRAKRDRADQAASYKVPYFVVVVQGTQVLSKRIFWINFGFSAGEKSTSFQDSVASTVINLESGKKPYDYELISGFQLTHDQLEYNKSVGRYAL